MEKSANESVSEKSFDVLSSVRLYRHDLQSLKYISPETRQRVYDEELSYIAEGINRPNYTEFILHEEDGQLVYFHEGRWRPYLNTLTKGLKTAQSEAQADPRKQFEADRRADDLRRGYHLQTMKPGETISWFYEFPREQMDLYGEKFIGDMGFFPERAMGYLCEAQKTIDGRLILRHQSVDNSDKDAFWAAMAVSDRGGSIEDMTAAYDNVLSQKHNDEYYAGRPLGGSIREENAWTAITKHQDLVDHLLNQIEQIARSNLPDAETEVVKKRLTYGVWARLKERLDEQSVGISQPEYGGYSAGSIQAQVESAYQSAAARGQVLFGCGGSITGENAILQASAKDVLNSIFGNQKKWFGCPYCGAKQYGDPCASHLYCSGCTAQVKDGRVISSGKSRALKKGFFEVIADEMALEWRKWNQNYNLSKEAKAAKRRTEPEVLKNT